MNIYVIRIAKSGLNTVSIRVEGSPIERKYETAPLVEHILSARVPTIQGISLLVDEEKETKRLSVSWKVLQPDSENILPVADNTLEANQDDLSDVLLELSDALPLPGSYVLHIIYDFRQRDILDSSISWGMISALKKLCLWHQGSFHVYVDCELPDHLICKFDFINEDFRIHQHADSDIAQFILSTKQIWTGQLSVYVNNLQPLNMENFSMFTLGNNKEDPVIVDFGSKTPSVSYKDVHVWLKPQINILTDIDISTIPLIFHSGRKFELRYEINKRHSDDCEALQSVCRHLCSEPTGAYLCRLYFAISHFPFCPQPQSSSKHWRQTLKDNGKFDILNEKVEFETSRLHFLLRPSRSDDLTVDNLITFNCHILHQQESINWNIYVDNILQNYQENSSDQSSGASTSIDFKPVNVLPLLGRYSTFQSHAHSVLKEWLGNRTQASISSSEFSSIIDNSLRYVSAEITKSWKRCIDVMEPLSIDIVHDKTAADTDIYSLQKMLLDFQPTSKSDKATVSRTASRQHRTVFDMHLKPQDILQHFPSYSESNGFSALQCKPTKFKLPSISTLRNFETAFKLSYHGIQYNLDELETEKFDKACRILVGKYVKFETRSIGSLEKVPSRLTIPVKKSPVKIHPKRSTSKIDDRKPYMKNSKENLPRAKKGDLFTSHRPTSSMVLRSTPKKTRSTKRKREENTADAQIRHKRKTYVRDNKKRLEVMISAALIENGVMEQSKKYSKCFRRLYNVSMAFLKDLKTSKNLEQIMRDTVHSNVHSVISFEA